VDNSFAPGIGHRLDGWANRDLNVGAIIGLAPNLQPVANLLHTNVDPAVRALPWVRLIDLADLRSAGLADAGDLAHDLAAAEEIIEVELQRYLRWLAGRPAAAAVRRMRGGAEEAARQELDRIAGELPAEVRPAVERLLLRTVHRLVHQPTLELRAAAEAGDGDLVRVLAGLFDAVPPDAGRREERA